MPVSGGDKHVTAIRIAFVVAFGLLLLSFTWTLSADRATHREAARQHARQFADETRQQIARVCREQPRRPLAECVLAAVEATREDQRAEHELAAQREMADWTLLMLVVSGFGLLISGFGLLALLRTIQQGKLGLARAREANRIAAVTGERQLRAYLVAKEFRVTRFLVGQRPMFSCKIKNAGQTPAYRVEMKGEWLQAEGHAACEAQVRFGGSYPSGVIGPGEERNPQFHFHEALTEEFTRKFRAGEVELGAVGVISYQDAFKRRHFTTFKVFLHPHWVDLEGSAGLAMCPKGNRAN